MGKLEETFLAVGVLRFLLAIAVIIGHTTPIFGISMTGGELAVQAFFIISGFYMSLILNEKYTSSGSYKLFLTNRFLRLYPIYWTILFVLIAISIFYIVKSGGTSFGFVKPYWIYFNTMDISSFLLLVFVNLFIIGQDVVYFLGLNPDTGYLYFTSDFQNTKPVLFSFLLMPQSWSISIEIIFYIIAPFILRKRPVVIIGLMVSLILIRIFILFYLELNHDPWTYRFLPSEFIFFLLGNLSYRFYKTLAITKQSKIIFYIVAFVLIFFIFSYDAIEFQTDLIKQILFVVIVSMSLPYLFLYTKTNSHDAQIGELSYPIYMCHLLVLSSFSLLKTIGIDNVSSGLYVAIVSIVFAWFLNYFVAKPIEAYRQKRVLGSV